MCGIGRVEKDEVVAPHAYVNPIPTPVIRYSEGLKYCLHRTMCDTTAHPAVWHMLLFNLNFVFCSVHTLVVIIADFAFEFIRSLKFGFGWKAVSGIWASSPRSIF